MKYSFLNISSYITLVLFVHQCYQLMLSILFKTILRKNHSDFIYKLYIIPNCVILSSKEPFIDSLFFINIIEH